MMRIVKIKNSIDITMHNGDKVTKVVRAMIPAAQQKYALGTRLNYCGPTGAIKNGEIVASTLTSITEYQIIEDEQ